jgi:hypothetical protein
VNLSLFLSLAVRRMRSSAWVTPVRHSVRHVLCCSAFPLVAALRSTCSSAACAASFAGFPATMAASDVPSPCIIGFRLLAFPMRAFGHIATGHRRDLPGSDAIPSGVMGSSTTAERQRLA